MKKFITVSAATLLMTGLSTSAISATVNFDKRNTSFSIDGGGGSEQNRQVYLWNTSRTNVNQQWIETKVDGKYYMYQKVGTPRCLDGGGGGEKGQPVVLWNCNSNNENQHWEKRPQSNGFVRLKKRGVSFSLDCKGGGARRQTCHLWSSQDSNINQHFKLTTVGGDSSGGGNNDGGNNTGEFGLNPNDDPWENFDLSRWKLDTPAGESSASDCDAQATEPQDWANNFPSRSEEYFFTHSDGGMRFVTEIGRATTGGSCSSRTRSELREMLRGSNTSIDTTGKNGDFRNNWALGYQPKNHNGNSGESWGAREGKLSATLRVNKVTTSGTDSQRGRTVIGQIHADKDEPLRLNYKHRAGTTNGCIYASSEIRNGDDINFELIGNTSCSSSPSNGIALGELFSYEIENDGADIIVVIRRGDSDGPVINSVRIELDKLNSGYDRNDDWMYFKAGAYTQNDTGNKGDSDIITFYRLDVDH